MMLKILVGPNGCGKSEYLNRLAGYNTHINTTSGLEKIKEVEIIVNYAVENGSNIYIDNVDVFIDIEKIEKLCNMLIEASKKVDVWVSTHHVLTLNWLEDQQAIDSVFLVHKGSLYPYFDTYTLEKLEVMGAGEAFCDTDLNAWWELCSERPLQASLEGLHTKEALEGSV